MNRKVLTHLMLGLCLLLAGGPLAAARKEVWVEVKSPHFVAYSDSGEADAREVLREFEEIRAVFLKVFPGIRVDAPKPMVLIAAQDEDSMKRFLPAAFEGKNPKRLAGMYQSGEDRNYAILRLDLPRGDQPYFTLFHEYTHSIIHLNFQGLPTWLDEGIADFYGTTQVQAKHVLLGRVPLGRLETLRNGILLPLETLLTVTHDSPHYREGDKTGAFYAQSWALVHYLFMNEHARKAGLFQAYVQALARTQDPVAAARESFGDLGQANSTLYAYLKQSRFPYLELDLSLKSDEKEFSARKLDEVQALVVRAEFLQHTRQAALAKPLLDQALILAPQRPEVQAALGFGLLHEQAYEAAFRAFQEALRLGSSDFRVPFHLAQLASWNLRNPERDSAQIIAWLETARALRPDYPGLHMLLCQEYSRDPKTAAQALEAGKRAVQLEPSNLSYLSSLGYACLNLDLESEARQIQTKLNQLAQGTVERQVAESFAQALNQYLEQRRSRDEGPQPVTTAATGGPSLPIFKLSLPAYMAPLAQEVLDLVGDGKTADAIQRVEAARSKARYDYDRKVLKGLLEQLKSRANAEKALLSK